MQRQQNVGHGLNFAGRFISLDGVLVEVLNLNTHAVANLFYYLKLFEVIFILAYSYGCIHMVWDIKFFS